MAEKKEEIKYTKYETARIIGSRALQIAMGAPFLIKLSEKELEEVRYNPVEIAKLELEQGVLPLTINRPLPKTIFAEEKKAKA